MKNRFVSGLFLATVAAASALASPKPPLAAVNLKSPACRAWRNLAIDQRHREDGLQTDQIAVARADGGLLFTWSDSPYRNDTPHSLWSISKTVSTTLLATALEKGKVKLTDRLTQYIPSSQRRNRRGVGAYEEITVDHLVQMTSGYQWSEHANDDVKDASDLPMMYSEGYKNFTRYMLEVDFAAYPGREWNYSSLNANFMMAILKKVYRSDYDDMPWTNLFGPLGIKSASFEQDQAGIFLGGSYVFLSAVDMTKLGALFLNDGKAPGGRRVLPEGWVERAHEPVTKSYAMIRSRDDFKIFGVFSKGGWWLNLPVPHVGKPFPKSPENLLMASGFLGQWLVVLPDQGLVIARTGHERDAEFRYFDQFVAGAVACFAK